ncbi:MAG: hypothetical protein ACOCQU_04000 [Halolamina sp.]
MSPRTLLLALLSLLLVSSGCLGVLDSRPPSDDRAVDLRDKVGASVADVESYRFDSHGSVAATDGDTSRSVTVDGEGAVNRSTERLRSVAETDGEERRRYVDGHTAYQECADPWGWGVEELDEETPWHRFAPLGRTLELLDESPVYWRGTETVDGRQTAVVVAHPTAETLSSAADRPDASIDSRGLENATLTVWVDNETTLPLQSRLEIDVERRGATAGATIDTEYAGYGQSVSVSLPDSVYSEQHELGCPGS